MTESNPYRRHHDMGGFEADPVDTSEHDKAPWEKRVDALMRLLSDDERQLLRVDELRRAIEDLGPDVYDRLSYYERWMSAITQIMLEKKVIGATELGERMARIAAREQAAGSTDAAPPLGRRGRWACGRSRSRLRPSPGTVSRGRLGRCKPRGHQQQRG